MSTLVEKLGILKKLAICDLKSRESSDKRCLKEKSQCSRVEPSRNWSAGAKKVQ
jgi:hypothetical protein